MFNSSKVEKSWIFNSSLYPLLFDTDFSTLLKVIGFCLISALLNDSLLEGEKQITLLYDSGPDCKVALKYWTFEYLAFLTGETSCCWNNNGISSCWNNNGIQNFKMKRTYVILEWIPQRKWIIKKASNICQHFLTAMNY